MPVKRGSFRSPSERQRAKWPGHFGDPTRAFGKVASAVAPAAPWQAGARRHTHCQYSNNRLGGPKNPGWGKGRVNNHPSVSAQTSSCSAVPGICCLPDKRRTHLPVSIRGVVSYRRASGSERGWPGYFGDATRALAPGKRGTHCQYLNNRPGGPKNPGWGKGRVNNHPSVSAQTSSSSAVPNNEIPGASAARLLRRSKAHGSHPARVTRICQCQTRGVGGPKNPGWGKAASSLTHPSRRKRHQPGLPDKRRWIPATRLRRPCKAHGSHPARVTRICQCQTNGGWGVDSYRRASGSERGWPGYFGDATRALAPGKRGTHCQYLNNRLGGPKNPGWGNSRVITHPSVSAQTSPSSGIPYIWPPAASATRLRRPCKTRFSQIVVLPLTSLKTPKPGSISRESCILSLPHPRGTWTIEE